MKPPNPRAARLLRVARTRAELTQEQLAVRAGTKQSTMREPRRLRERRGPEGPGPERGTGRLSDSLAQGVGA